MGEFLNVMDWGSDLFDCLKVFPQILPCFDQNGYNCKLGKSPPCFPQEKETYLKFFVVVRQVEIRAVHSCTLTFD